MRCFNCVIDPDNVFWGIFDRGKGLDIPDDLKRLYDRVKVRLDAQMSAFRFSTDLTAVYIDPTDRCNADCPYCYIPQAIRRNGRSMDSGQLECALRKIADYFKESSRKAVIVFHAAEPLLVKEMIFDAMEKYADRFKFGLQTNAILLEGGDVKFLKRHGVGVGISLDSNSSFANDSLRRGWHEGGNFEKAVRAIELFDGYEGLNVITTITRSNASGLVQMLEFLHGKKVPCVLFNPVRITQRSSRGLKPNAVRMAGYFIKAVDKAIELSSRTARRIIIGNFANTILAIIAPAARRLMCDISPCGAGRCFLTITASGQMIPCGEFIGLKGFSGGNIFKAGIEEALRSKPFKRIRRRIVERIDECKACVYRNICGAPCPAELDSLGDMHKSAVFCEFYKRVIDHAFKLIAEGKERYALREDGLGGLKYEYELSKGYHSWRKQLGR